MDIQVKMDADKLKSIADGLVATCKATWPEVMAARGIMGMAALAPKVVSMVEKTAGDLNLISSDKKALAVQIICNLVPDTWVPDWVLAPIVSWIIERAVSALQTKLAGIR